MNLYPFQVEAVAKTVKFLRERGCCYNASEMGLGKSAVVIKAVAQMSLGFTKTLVICPAVVALVWAKEVEKWDPDRMSEWHVISYNKAAGKKFLPHLKESRWDFLILDEAHYLKNLKAIRTKEILKHIWSTARYKIALSGTPMTQSIMDIWPIVSRMAPEDFKDYWEFAKNYTNIVRIPFGPGYKFEGVKNHDKLRAIMDKKFFFRYEKEKVLKDLPPKTYQNIPLGEEYRVKADPEEEKRYILLLKESYAKNLPPPKPPIPIATALKEQGLKKVPAVVEFCKNILDSGEPLVLFFVHTSTGEALEKALEKYKPVKIEGATSEKKRKEAIESFQSGGTNLFIGQIAAAGIGVTLTRSSTVVFGERSFSPSEVNQAVDRCHRIGTQKPVMVYYFTVLDSLDERIEEILSEKIRNFQKVLAC